MKQYLKKGLIVGALGAALLFGATSANAATSIQSIPNAKVYQASINPADGSGPLQKKTQEVARDLGLNLDGKFNRFNVYVNDAKPNAGLYAKFAHNNTRGNKWVTKSYKLSPAEAGFFKSKYLTESAETQGAVVKSVPVSTPAGTSGQNATAKTPEVSEAEKKINYRQSKWEQFCSSITEPENVYDANAPVGRPILRYRTPHFRSVLLKEFGQPSTQQKSKARYLPLTNKFVGTGKFTKRSEVIKARLADYRESISGLNSALFGIQDLHGTLESWTKPSDVNKDTRPLGDKPFTELNEHGFEDWRGVYSPAEFAKAAKGNFLDAMLLRQEPVNNGYVTDTLVEFENNQSLPDLVVKPNLFTHKRLESDLMWAKEHQKRLCLEDLFKPDPVPVEKPVAQPATAPPVVEVDPGTDKIQAGYERMLELNRSLVKQNAELMNRVNEILTALRE
ncbi:MAG: hypothetical protein U9R08_03300 [Nanoarchaeota archaeon]|nr:hypothetical protein [Nanoarchaeota archaeon]